MKKLTCEICNGTGIIMKFRHIAEGVCFSCDGEGFYMVDSETYNNHIEYKTRHKGIYIQFENGKVTNVIKSETLVDPNKKKGDNLVPEQLVVGGNVVYYRSSYNGITKKSDMYSASFKHMSDENTLEIITRLIKCNYKNTIELLTTFGADAEKINELKLKLENAQNEALEQLKENGY